MKKIIRTLVIDRGGSAADCGHPFRICPIVDLCRADLVGRIWLPGRRFEFQRRGE